MSYQNTSQSCPKHPDQKLSLINAAKGNKQCTICIVQESVKSGNFALKDRFCPKHPGYEKLFFCEEDLKGLCEKCIDLHSEHKIYTIALQAR